jgi:hypothetical protein
MRLAFQPQLSRMTSPGQHAVQSYQESPVVTISKIASHVVWKTERFGNCTFHRTSEVVERTRIWGQWRHSRLHGYISTPLRRHSYALCSLVLRCTRDRTIPSQVGAAPHRRQSADPGSPCEMTWYIHRNIENEITDWSSIRYAGRRSTRRHRRSAGRAYSTGKDQFLRRLYQISKNRLKTHEGHNGS